MRESDIRPADLLAEYLRLSAEDARRFGSDGGALVARACPGCGGDETVPAFAKNGFDLVRCGTCDTLYVMQVPSPEDLAEFYRDSPSQRYWSDVFFPAVAAARRTHVFRPRAEAMTALFDKYGLAHRRLVDIGAGVGIFAEVARATNAARDIRAVEPNGRMAASCQGRGFETFSGFAADAAADPAWAGWADIAVSFEVIEHVVEPVQLVADMAALVRPGGALLLSGLCGDGFDIRVLGAQSNAVSPPHHLTFLSRTGVTAMMARSGVELLEFLTPGKLDVDIVRNAEAMTPGAVSDPFLSHLLRRVGDDVREAFQGFLAAHGLSSHMWLLARRTV